MKLHIRTFGSGRPLVILHGLFGSSDNWLTAGKKLAGNGLRVILPDLRNHGRSPHSETHTYEAMAGDVLELIGSEDLSQPVLVGHSMGGKTAMLTALQHPALVGAVVVIDMAPGEYPGEHHEAAAALAELDVRNITGRGQADDLLASRITDPGTRQFLLKNLYRTEGGRFDWRFNLQTLKNEIGNMRQAVSSNKPFDKPALFIRGEHSDYIGPGREEEIRRLFPRARIVTAPGAGHWVHADAPEWVVENVTSILKTIPLQ
jgi:pimeloyl-ACP methyl ester carboxylesterase